MGEIPLGINTPDQQTVDPLGQSLENVTVSQLGVRSRPGLSLLIDTGTAAKVDGIYDWRENDVGVVVSNGKTFIINDTSFLTSSFLLLESGSFLLLEDGFRLLLESLPEKTEVTGATDLVIGTRPTFANFGDYLYIANGAQIQELHFAQAYVANGGTDYKCILNHTSGDDTDEPGVGANWATYWTADGSGGGYDAWVTATRYGSGTADVVEDSSAPTLVSFVTAAESYLMAMENATQRVWFSYPGQPWRWDSEWVSAEQLPDDLVSILYHDGELWACGTRSIEPLVNDGVTPWIKSGYRAITHGVLAPYSWTYCPQINTFVWIDNTRRVVSLQDRNPQSLNYALDTWLQQVTTVDDCLADYYVTDSIPKLVLQFPTSAQAVEINLLNNTFTELTTDGKTIWDVNSIEQFPGWDMIVSGHRSDGTVNKISSNTTKDINLDIPVILRTQRVPTINTQRVRALALHFTKTLNAASAGDASITVRWRNDGGTWSTARTITLSTNEETDFVREIHRLGSYGQFRQYEFTLTNMHPYSLTRCVEL